VGGSGVGAAVDAFNLNATYFEMAQVPVMGAIFNKLNTEGYYSLENCKEQVTSYFRQNEHQQLQGRIPFGFLPMYEKLGADDAINHVDEYIQLFSNHVDVQAVLDSATRVKQRYSSDSIVATTMEIDAPSSANNSTPPTKRMRLNGQHNGSKRKAAAVLTRADVERLASQQGAATA